MDKSLFDLTAATLQSARVRGDHIMIPLDPDGPATQKHIIALIMSLYTMTLPAEDLLKTRGTWHRVFGEDGDGKTLQVSDTRLGSFSMSGIGDQVDNLALPTPPEHAHALLFQMRENLSAVKKMILSSLQYAQKTEIPGKEGTFWAMTFKSSTTASVVATILNDLVSLHGVSQKALFMNTEPTKTGEMVVFISDTARETLFQKEGAIPPLPPLPPR